MFRCQDCGKTWKLGESIVCPACGKDSARLDVPQTPQIRLVETPPEPAPPASVKVEDSLRRIPWKIVLGVVLAGGILLGIKVLIVGGAPKHEETPPTVAEDPQPPAAPKVALPRPLPIQPPLPPEAPVKPEVAPVVPPETAKGEPAPPKEVPAPLPAPAPVPAPKETPEIVVSKPAPDLPRDLVGYWNFDEGTGTDVADASGCGNGGVLIGQGTRWIKGRVGNALQFDGKGGYVSCGLSRIPGPAQPQTLAFWVRIERAPDQDQVLISSTNDAQKSGVEAGFREGKLMISAWGGAELVSAPPPGLNDWHLCAYVFDGSSHLLYVDGKEAARSSKAVPSAQPPSRLQFGRWTGGANSFTGGVDEVRLFARPLSPEEIAKLAAPAAAPDAPADPAGTVDLLKLIDPRRDSVAGAWTFAEGALWSPGTPWSRLQIPYAPPEEYDLTLIVTRTANVESLNIGMVGGGRQFLALLDGWGGSKSGLEMLDGKHAADNETTVLRQLFTNDRRATVVCSVRKDGVRVAVDGNVHIDWKSSFKRLSLYPYWNVPSSESLLLGAYEAVWRFDAIKLRPVSGTGRALVPNAPEAAAPREPENPPGAATPGFLSEYYEGVWARLPDFSQLKPVRAARVEQIDTSQKLRPVLFAFRFTGYLRVIEDGEYTFYLNSTDGSRLLIGATEVVNNDLVHRLQEKSGRIRLKTGKHALTVEYFDQTRGEQLDVLWSGPGTPRGPLPKEALFFPNVPIPVVKAAPVTPVKPDPPPEPVKSREDRIEQFKKDVASKDDAVRLAALQSARDLRDKGVRALLARRLENEPDGIRIAAAQALSFQKHPEAAAALGRGLVINQKNESVTKTIITSLGDLGMCAALPHLEAAITLNNGLFAADALAQITRIGCPESAAGLVKLRKSAEDDYQKFFASQSGSGARTMPTTYNPKYPLAHVYSPIVTALYKLMGVSTTQEDLEKRIKKGEHLQNLGTIYYCEETDKTFELTVTGPPRSCPLAPAVKSHADILLRHRKP
jgi:hypothetical protein